MSNRMISRRVALRILGLAPAAAGVGYAAVAGASSDEGAAVAMSHDPGMATVLAQAEVYSKIIHSQTWWGEETSKDSGETNGEKVARIAHDMWSAFKVGIYHHDETMTTQSDLLEQLFETKVGGTAVTWSGKAVVRNLANFDDRMPSRGGVGKTYAQLMVCAFRCGAEAAKVEKTNAVGVEAYNTAWNTVSVQTFATLQKTQPTLEKVDIGGGIRLLDGGC